MKNAIYNVQEKRTRRGAVFQTINGCAAHSAPVLATWYIRSQVLLFQSNAIFIPPFVLPIYRE